MPELVLRTNPSQATAVVVGIFTIPATGTATFDRDEEIKLLQQDATLRDKLTDGAFDSATTSTIQILDGGILVPQAEALRALTKTHRFDLFRKRFADASARTGDSTTYTAADQFSFGLQEDDGSIWFLKTISPILWVLFKADTTANVSGNDMHLGWVKDATTRFIAFGQTTYEGLEFIFRGSGVVGTPVNIKAICRAKDSGKTGDMRVFDLTGIATIVEKTGISNNTFDIVDLGTISSIPSGESRFEIQGRKSPSTGTTLEFKALIVEF